MLRHGCLSLNSIQTQVGKYADVPLNPLTQALDSLVILTPLSQVITVLFAGCVDITLFDYLGCEGRISAKD
jgi:hypothetical protein